MHPTNKRNLFIGTTALTILGLLTLNSCKTIPAKAKAIQPFHSDKYLGKWYEIARLENRFEKGLTNIIATYSMLDDGKIKVVNRGYNPAKGKYEQAIGKAKFVKNPQIAKLKVSFFGPFYSGYNVVAIDENYQYALIVGSNLDYLWILSREKTIPEAIKAEYLKKAKTIGYKVSELIWVEHD